MSDYLWDKTGEPDAEVERLENLLGGLRHQPQKLELPPAAPRARFRHTSFYRRAALVAAALALAALAGTLLALRRAGDYGGRTEPSVATVGSSPRVASSPEATPSHTGSEAPGAQPSGSPHGLRPKTDEAAAGYQNAERSVAGRAKRARRGAVRVAGGRQARGREPSGVAAEVAASDTLRRAEAKDQLLYALRLASAQLGEVRRKTLGADNRAEAEEPKARIR